MSTDGARMAMRGVELMDDGECVLAAAWGIKGLVVRGQLMCGGGKPSS